MGKREFTAFTDSFLKRAGQEYMSMQQIDNLKRQEKSAKENLTYQKKRHKEDTELDIAKLIVAARREETETEAPLSGAERLQDVQADVLETRVEELDKLRAEGKISPQDYIDKLSMYSSYKRTHVTGMPKGGGGKGAKGITPATAVSSINTIHDDKRYLRSDIESIKLKDPSAQIAIDAMYRIENMVSEEAAKQIYDTAIQQMEAAITEAQNKGESINDFYVDKTKNIFLSYFIRHKDELFYRQIRDGLGRTSETIKAPAGTDEDKVFDEIIEAIK